MEKLSKRKKKKKMMMMKRRRIGQRLRLNRFDGLLVNVGSDSNP
jgi:hypothetical protein